MRAPLNGSPRITNPHGAPGWGTFGKHTGIDYSAAIGTPVYAPAAGTVRSVSYGSSGGNLIEMAIGPHWHRFLHMDRIVKKSGSFKEGELIGYSGNTGDTTGPHLHHDVRLAGTAWNSSFANYIDPLALLTPQGGDMAETITDDSSRQLGFHLLGRNGRDGKPNALKSPQNDLIGKDLTNAYLQQLFLSSESRDWRDSRLNAVYSERDALKVQVSKLEAEKREHIKQIAELKQLDDTPAETVDPATAVKAQNWDDLVSIVKKARG